MSNAEQLACVYAALLLEDDGVPVTEDKIKTIVNKAGVTVAPFWPSLFAKFLETRKISDMISSIGAAPAAGGAAAAEEAVEEKKEEEVAEEEEEEEESDDDMGFGLFD